MRKTFWSVLALGICLAAAPAGADNWDTATDTDNGNTTENALVHGSDQFHDLAAIAAVADQDWFRAIVPSRASFEVIVDGTSGEVGPYINFARVDSAGLTLQNDEGVGSFYAPYGINLGDVRAIQWQNTTAAPQESFLRVLSGGSCTANCTADDVYMIRAYETTYSIPRFNNSSSQITILQIANPTDGPISGNLWFYSSGASPTLLGSSAFTIAPRGLLVVNTATLPFASGTGGSITVSHDGRYGDLAGKAVAVEPASGFTFDTPMLPRPL